MELSSLPLWAQNLGAVLLTACTAIALTWNERQKKDKPAAEPGSDSQVVAATFIERRLMEDLTTSVRNLDGSVRVLTGHVEKINDRMHEDEIVRAAVAKMKADGASPR